MDGGQNAGERAKESARTPHMGPQRAETFYSSHTEPRGWLRRAGSVIQLWMEEERK